jgi:energy-coupling factor transporter ATP-binding protein EcfA2
MNAIYKYPVSNAFDAMTVSEEGQDLNVFENNLYVEINHLRSENYRNDLLKSLNIANDTTYEYKSSYPTNKKIVIAGHIGCGKTTELLYLKQYIHNPLGYYVVYVSAEDGFDIWNFRAEDFYLHIISGLLHANKTDGLNINANALEKLGKKLFSDTEVIAELKNTFNFDAVLEQGFKLDFWVKFGLTFKSIFTSQNTTTRQVREKIKNDKAGIVQELNKILIDVRQQIITQKLGKDLLIVVDGLEKINELSYQTLFIDDVGVLKNIGTNIIMPVPVSMLYKLGKAPERFDYRHIIPMLDLENIDKKQDIYTTLTDFVQRKIDINSIFENIEDITLCIDYSGGSPRLLNKMINTSLQKTEKLKIVRQDIIDAANQCASHIWQSLNTQQKDILKKGYINPQEFQSGDDNVNKLLENLVLLKYNGTIRINPVLLTYEYFEKWQVKPQIQTNERNI